MFDVLKKLMFARQINFSRGEISLLGHPVIMCPIVTFVEIRKLLEKIDATALLYIASKKSGLSYLTTLQKKYGMDAEKLLEWGINTISLAGWGITNTKKLDFGNKVAITYLEDSSFVKVYGRSTEPIDDVFRGYAAATATLCFKTDMDAIETKCAAMGDKICEIIAKPHGSFDVSDKKTRTQLVVGNKEIMKLLNLEG